MPKSAKEIGDWQKRLIEEFGGEGRLVGHRAIGLNDSERQHALRMVESSHGFTYLMDSYQDFCLQTFDEAASHSHRINVFSLSINSATFRSLRAGLNTFYDGYYFEASSHLRAAFENTTYLCTVLRGIFWFDELYGFVNTSGVPQATSDAFKTQHSHRLKMERIVKEHCYGPSSGLSAQQQEEISQCMRIMHLHVHRNESLIIHAVVDIVKSKIYPTPHPTFDLHRATMFCNMAVLASWMHLKVLPYISIPSMYSVEWARRRELLDDSFRFYLSGEQKEPWDSLVAMMDKSFSLDPAIAEQQVTRT